jgi:hypothetical protein
MVLCRRVRPPAPPEGRRPVSVPRSTVSFGSRENDHRAARRRSSWSAVSNTPRGELLGRSVPSFDGCVPDDPGSRGDVRGMPYAKAGGWSQIAPGVRQAGVLDPSLSSPRHAGCLKHFDCRDLESPSEIGMSLLRLLLPLSRFLCSSLRCSSVITWRSNAYFTRYKSARQWDIPTGHKGVGPDRSSSPA